MPRKETSSSVPQGAITGSPSATRAHACRTPSCPAPDAAPIDQYRQDIWDSFPHLKRDTGPVRTLVAPDGNRRNARLLSIHPYHETQD